MAARHSACNCVLSVLRAPIFRGTVPPRTSYGGNKRYSLCSQLGCLQPLFENQSSPIMPFILHFHPLLHCWLCMGYMTATQIQVKMGIYSRPASHKRLSSFARLWHPGIALSRKSYCFFWLPLCPLRHTLLTTIADNRAGKCGGILPD